MNQVHAIMIEDALALLASKSNVTQYEILAALQAGQAAVTDAFNTLIAAGVRQLCESYGQAGAESMLLTAQQQQAIRQS